MNYNGEEKNVSIKHYILNSYHTHIKACCIIFFLLGILCIVLGHDITRKENQILGAVLITTGSTFIGASSVTLIFKSAIVILTQKEIMKETIEETYQKILFTSIPKFRVVRYISEVIIKSDPENPEIPIMAVNDVRTLVNLHDRTVSQKKEKMMGVPQEQKFILENVKIKNVKIGEEAYFLGKNIAVNEKTITFPDGNIERQYDYVIPFGCTIGKDEMVTIDENYLLSPCSANETKTDCFGFSLFFPCEILIIKMRAEDGFYFKDVEAKLHDCFTDEKIEIKTAPSYVTTKEGNIEEIMWILTPNEIIQEDACDIFFKLIKIDKDESS